MPLLLFIDLLLIVILMEVGMAVAANKRPVMTLFSGANCMYSHQVRIVC